MSFLFVRHVGRGGTGTGIRAPFYAPNDTLPRGSLRRRTSETVLTAGKEPFFRRIFCCIQKNTKTRMKKV